MGSNDALHNDTKCEAIDRGLGISNFQNLHFENEDSFFSLNENECIYSTHICLLCHVDSCCCIFV